jgi:hypothetical protein
MIRQRLFVAAVIAVLAAPAVLAQTQGDVIKPPPTKSDGSVVVPPAAHVDPGIQKGKPPEQSQLPEEKDQLAGPDAPKVDGPRRPRTD